MRLAGRPGIGPRGNGQTRSGTFRVLWPIGCLRDGSGVQINCEGTATRYGTVVGTLTFRGEPGAKSGSLRWRGQGFLDNGETVIGTGEGAWEEMGKHQWRTRMIVTTSDGGCHASDGHLDLATRTLKGKMLEWP